MSAQLEIVEPALDVDLGNRRAVVVLRSSDRDLLSSLEAKKLACTVAGQKGLIGAAIRTAGNPYTVNADGTALTAEQLLGGFPVGGKFQVDYEIGSSL